jgi:preprotein translocase subunit SecE
MSVINQIISYFRSSKEEFKKVSWPSRRDTVRYSALVIGVSVAVAVGFALLDAGFSKAVDVLITQRAQSKIQQQESVPAAQPTTAPAPAAAPAPTLDIKNVQPIVTPQKDATKK